MTGHVRSPTVQQNLETTSSTSSLPTNTFQVRSAVIMMESRFVLVKFSKKGSTISLNMKESVQGFMLLLKASMVVPFSRHTDLYRQKQELQAH